MNNYFKLCTQYYEADKPFANPRILAHYLPLAQFADGPILEPMCGTGRFLTAMLENGLDIDGFDRSPEMLAVCRQKLKSEDQVRVTQQSIHEFELPRKYAMAFICSGSFSLITDLDEVKMSLRQIWRHLVPGGKFFVEVSHFVSEESHSGPWGGTWLELNDGNCLVLGGISKYDPDEQVSLSMNRYDLVSIDGKILESEYEPFDLRYYRVEEFTELLRESGFLEIRCTGGFEGGVATPSTPELFFECSRL